MAIINSTMKLFTNIILSSSKGSILLRCFKLPVPLAHWEAVNNHMCSCKSQEKPVRQVREPSEGFDLRHSFYMQETNWSSKLTFSRERWLGIAPF